MIIRSYSVIFIFYLLVIQLYLSIIYLFIIFDFSYIYLFVFSLYLLIFFSVSISADPNRVPYDLPEAESELVAGFITEYSTIYSSLILLTEYANIIIFIYLLVVIFSIYPFNLSSILSIICLIRSTLNRLKFDELMITG